MSAPKYKVGDKVVLLRHDFVPADELIGKTYEILRVNTGTSSYFDRNLNKDVSTCWYGFTEYWNAPEQCFVSAAIYNSKLYKLLNEEEHGQNRS